MSQVVQEDNFYDEGYIDDEVVIDNKIKFSKIRLYGREKESKALHEIFTEVCSKKSTEVVLISGYSGTGKSAIVETLAKEIQLQAKDDKNGRYPQSEREYSDKDNKCECAKRSFFLTGKFDDLQRADPFSAITQAFSEFPNALQRQDEDGKMLQRIRNRVMMSVGSEGKVLTDFVPCLRCILEDAVIDDDATSTSNPSSVGSGTVAIGGAAKHHMWNRLIYIFQQFLTAICTEEHTIVLFLDDLQWADAPSLDLITSLIRDASLRNFLLIGAVRSNEVDDDHIFNKKFTRVIEQTKTIHRFDILNLSLDDINAFISETLDVDVEESLPLTRALYSKTRGNIFFTMQALEEWNRSNVIFYSAITFQWEWNLKEVEIAGSRLSEDVVGVVADKIRSAPDILQEALMIASYTRSNFDFETLHSLLKAVGKHEISRDELLQLLDTAILQNLLVNMVGSKDYKFSHDRIQQAAYNLLPKCEERDNLRQRIGYHLLKIGFSDIGEDWMLFVAAEHLNKSSNTNSKGAGDLDALELAKLNLLVGEKAMLVAAFKPASRYLQMAQKLLLAIDSWTDHYEMKLRLMRVVMDLELALGNHDRGYAIGKEVLDNTRTSNDALPAYRTLALALRRQERNDEALDFIMKALDVLCRFQKKNHLFHATKDIFLVKKYLKRHSDNDILLLPKITEEKILWISAFLYDCCIQAYLCGNLLQTLHCTIHNVVLSFEHGLCSFHSHAYLSYGLLASDRFGEKEMGLRLSRLAKEILIRSDDNKQVESNVCMCSGAFIDSWTLPTSLVLENFRRGHIAGMQSGDIEYGFRNAMYEVYYSYLFGQPLVAIEQASSELAEKVFTCNVDSILGPLLQMRFLFTHLVGSASSTNLDSQSAYLDWEEIKNYGMIGKNDQEGESIKLHQGLLSRLQLAVYFDELEVAEKMLNMAHKILQLDAQYHVVTVKLFFSGLAASGLYRKTKKKRYKSLAKKMILRLKKTGGKNNNHRYLLMKADLKSIAHGRSSGLYDEAISSALEIGCTQDAALGCELAGKYHMNNGSNELAKKCFEQALHLYRSWGAMKKVKHLQCKHACFFRDMASNAIA